MLFERREKVCLRLRAPNNLLFIHSFFLRTGHMALSFSLLKIFVKENDSCHASSISIKVHVKNYSRGDEYFI